KAADPKTLVVTLKTPAVAFLSQLASPTGSILSETALTTRGEEAYSENPVTSGAFTVDEWRKGDRVILKKNPNFWQAKNV
ncbi:ABC transporter substrate-binding protein, partial [Klebsiella pneumoniae]|uniref:ABC transporter substrate-binding protein n=1 Tax=Klebsiella pneumoniae TaxID=573 RepID=UPI002732281D